MDYILLLVGFVLRNKLIDNILNLGRSEGFDEVHALDVNKIALTIFDQLQDLHHMGNTERLWLETAALLHDVAKPKNRENHHKIARDMIAGFADLPFGLTERKLIGLIARYHRGSLPNETHKYFRQLDTESRNYVVKIASILRIADSFVSGKSNITTLNCYIRDFEITAYLKCESNISFRKVIKKADLFEKVFRKSFVLNMKIVPDLALSEA